MKKQLKSFAFAVLAGAVITSCADSASINQEAASSYTQEMGKIRSQGAIDTTSNTARRIHHVFNKMVPYANQQNETGLEFNWQINVIKSKEPQCLGYAWRENGFLYRFSGYLTTKR